MSEAEGSKSKKRQSFTLMLFIDSKDGQTRQMGIGLTLIGSIMVIVITAIVILSILYYRDERRIE